MTASPINCFSLDVSGNSAAKVIFRAVAPFGGDIQT